MTQMKMGEDVKVEIRTRFTPSAVQRKVINAFIKVIQDVGYASDVYSLPTQKLRDICNLPSNDNADLKRSLTQLQYISFQYNYLKKGGEIYDSLVVFPRISLHTETDTTTFEVLPFIRDQILDPKMYVMLNLLLIANFSSTYTITLYEFLKDYQNSPKVPRLTIDQFRDLMCVSPEQYKTFNNLKARIIEPAVIEINEKSDIECNYQLLKSGGNHYTEIQWEVRSKLNPKEGVITTSYAFPHYLKEMLPEEHQTKPVILALMKYVHREDYTKANVKYALENYKDSFIGLLALSLQHDYAGHERSRLRTIIEESVIEPVKVIEYVPKLEEPMVVALEEEDFNEEILDDLREVLADRYNP